MAKQTSTTRTRARTRARAAPGADETAGADCQLRPDGSIRWQLGGEDYTLEPLVLDDYLRLYRSKRDARGEASDDLLRAVALPAESDEQRAAKRVALNDANVEAVERSLVWWSELFEAAAGAEFPRAHAPAWVVTPDAQDKVLEHLVGPLPPGVG